MNLSVISVGFVTGLAVVTATAWLGAVLIACRRRFGFAAATALVAAVLTVVTAADVVNAYYEYRPTIADVFGLARWTTLSSRQVALLTAPPSPSSSLAAREPNAAAAGRPRHAVLPVGQATRRAVAARGAVTSVAVTDGQTSFPVGRVLVYLPPQYFTDPTARFPTVYLLHGSPGEPADWLRSADAFHVGAELAGAGHPLILVFPPVGRSWSDDSECVDGAHEAVETYLIQHVVPTIDARFRTIPSRNDRSIGGLSAGGFCALNLGLRHRDLFSAVLDFSGYTHPTHQGGMAALFGHRPDLAAVVAANSPDRYAADLPALPPTRVFFACGAEEGGIAAAMRAMAATLGARGIPATMQRFPGGHTFAVWRPALAAALAWLTGVEETSTAPAIARPVV